MQSDVVRGPGQATPFAGSAQQASILGNLYVFAGYGYILALLTYTVIVPAGWLLFSIRSNCLGRSGMVRQSLLFGTAESPLCGNGVSGQILALLVPLLELALLLLMIRGPKRPEGAPLPAAMEARVRAIFTPLVPRFAELRLWQWQGTPRITQDGILFSPAVVREFAAWAGGAAVNLSRIPAYYAIFATLHEVGHFVMHDLLYNRGADRAIPVVSAFVGMLLFVAAPAGAFVESFWLKVVLTALECLAAALFTRLVLRCILTNLEFLMDNFAVALVTGLAGRRLSMPAFLREDRKRWLERSHPALAVRREYLRSMQCDAFLWTWLLAMPLMALVEDTSAASFATTASIQILLAWNDLLATASLVVLGVFGGAAATAPASRHAWACFGLVWLLMMVIGTAQELSLLRHDFALDVHRLMFHGRIALWLLMLVAPLLGAAIRRWSDWFDAMPNRNPRPVAASAPAHPVTTHPVGPGFPSPRQWLRRVGHAFDSVSLWIFHGSLTLAVAEAAVFGLILVHYVLDTGIWSWTDVVIFGTWFAIPLGHALRPFWWPTLVLDWLFQTVFMSIVVVLWLVVTYLFDLRQLVTDDTLHAQMLANPNLLLNPLLDGTVFSARGDAMLQQILSLWLLMFVVGSLRLVGQSLAKRQQSGMNYERT